MTTIACDRLVMSSDSLTLDDNGTYPSPKIVRIRKSLFGFAGDADLIEQAVKWLKTKARSDRTRPVFQPDAEFVGLELRGDRRGEPGHIFLWYAGLMPIPNGRQFYAIGSGGVAAMAAMLCNKTTREAVAVAAECDPNTGGEIVTEELWPKSPKAPRQ
jgi:hypothetical protein